MKNKAKKEKNTLPVTKAEYSDAQLMLLFVAEVKKVLEKTEGISAVRFVPKMEGYLIYYKVDETDYKISVEKRTLASGYKAEKFIDGFRKASASFKSEQQYSSAISKIFNLKTKKTRDSNKR